MKPSHESIQALLAESITVLCKNGLQYRSNFTIQGLLGITLDDEDVFLVDIHEKIGESRSLAHGSASKRRHRERGSRRAKRRKSGSDISRSSSPGVQISDSEPASPCSREEENSFAASRSRDSSTRIVTDTSASKQKAITTDRTSVERQLDLDMGVEHILELPKDMSPWPQTLHVSEDLPVNRTPSEIESGETDFQNVSRTKERIDSGEKVIVKRETDDEVVFVKQEKSDSADVDHSRTRKAAETFPKHTEGAYQDSDPDSQTDFSSQGFFQHAQPFPIPSDQGFAQDTSANMSDPFQPANDESLAGGEASTSMMMPHGQKYIRSLAQNQLPGQVGYGKRFQHQIGKDTDDGNYATGFQILPGSEAVPATVTRYPAPSLARQGEVPLVVDDTGDKWFQGISVSANKIKAIELKASMAKRPSRYLLNKLVDIVFSEEELGNARGVRGLDSLKVEAIQEYLYKKCESLGFEQMPPDMFTVVVQNKIGNFRASKKQKQYQEEEESMTETEIIPLRAAWDS